MAIDVMGSILIALGVVFSLYYTFWLFISPYVLADERSRKVLGGMFPIDNYWAKVIPLYGLVMLLSFLGVFVGIVIIKAKASVEEHEKRK